MKLEGGIGLYWVVSFMFVPWLIKLPILDVMVKVLVGSNLYLHVNLSMNSLFLLLKHVPHCCSNDEREKHTNI